MNLIHFTPEQSTVIRLIDHQNGLTTIGFRDPKTGLPSYDYDYPDEERARYDSLKGAEHPGAFFRQELRAGRWPQHVAKRPAGEAAPAAAPPVAEVIPAAPQPTPPAKLAEKAQDVTQQAQALVVKDQASYESAAEMGRGIIALKKSAEEHHRPVIDAAFRAHREACAALARIIDPLKGAEATLRGKMEVFLLSEKRRQEEERRRQQEEAARLQREMLERLRREQEEAARLARERAESEAAAREAELEAKIEHAEACGASPAEIAAIVEQAEEQAPPVVPVVVPVVPAAPVVVPVVPVAALPRAKGVGSVTSVVGEVQDKMALLRWIVDHPEYADIVDISQAKLDRAGKLTNGKLAMAGVIWREKVGVRIRS